MTHASSNNHGYFIALASFVGNLLRSDQIEMHVSYHLELATCVNHLPIEISNII